MQPDTGSASSGGCYERYVALSVVTTEDGIDPTKEVTVTVSK